MTFHVGQKVVCINDKRWPGEPPPYVTRGAVYTVRDILIEEGHIAPWHTLLFEEIADCITPGWCIGFEQSAFRPIVEKKTDISFAHEILRKVSRKQTVRA